MYSGGMCPQVSPIFWRGLHSTRVCLNPDDLQSGHRLCVDPGFGKISSSVPKLMLGYGNQEHFQDETYGGFQCRWEDQNCSVGKCVTVLEPMCLLEWK
jgi:hypothetical protein